MATGFSDSSHRNRHFSNHINPRVPRSANDRSGMSMNRYRRRGICNNGQTIETCRFYSEGLCQYGDRCRYCHIDYTTPGSSNSQITPSYSQEQHLRLPKPIQQQQSQNSQTPNVQQLFDNKETELQSKDTQNINNLDDCQSAIATDAQSKSDNEPSDSSTHSLGKSRNMSSLYDKWVQAPEFIPSINKTKVMKSYAEAVNPSTGVEDKDKSEMKLCPYAEMHGICSYGEGECNYLHGNICDLCGTASLHPFNQEKRKLHIQGCIEQHERNMELSFAIQRSKEKSCGICFETIMEKSAREQRFGILPSCNHCFCLTCIRKWRQAKQFDNKIIRACPECRVTSDFVCPSMYWVDTKEEKEKLIEDYKYALSQKNCKYFKQGSGKCPFGNKCFYLHALPDGTKTDVGPPPRNPRRQAHDGDIDVLQQIILWDFLDNREHRWLYSIADDLEDLVAFFSDSEDSDWSDYDFFFD